MEIVWISYSLSKWRFSCSSKWLCSPSPLTIVLTIEAIMVVVFGACSLVSFKLVSFWYPFLELQLTTYHSNISVQIKRRKQTRHCLLWVRGYVVFLCYMILERRNYHRRAQSYLSFIQHKILTPPPLVGLLSIHLKWTQWDWLEVFKLGFGGHST